MAWRLNAMRERIKLEFFAGMSDAGSGKRLMGRS